MPKTVNKGRTGLIYMAVNKVNGKKYIGQTMHNIDFRKRQHLYDSVKKPKNAPVFYNALRKYGSSQFNWIILEDNIKEKKLDSKEIFFIKNENSRVPNGYNISKGGSSPKLLSKETKEKISKTLGNKKIGPHKDKDWLYNKYAIEEYSLKDISKIVKCSTECIRDWLKKFNITIRPKGHKTKRSREATSKEVLSRRQNCLYRDKEWLYNQYIINEFSANDMAEKANCRMATVLVYLKKFEIKIRGREEYTQRRKIKVSEANFKNKNHANVEKSWLYEKYINEGLSYYDIALLANCSSVHISNKIKEFEIPTHPIGYLSEKRKKSIIENHKSKNKPYKNKVWLFNKYIVEEYSCVEVSKMAKTDKTTISKYLRKFDIKIRKGGMITQRSINKRYYKNLVEVEVL